MNACVPVVVNHGVPVGACVRACVRANNRKPGIIIRSPVYAVHRSFLLSVQWVPARPLVVGWLALRLSACEFGSAGSGLHFVMRSERMADAMHEMGFEGELLVSTGSPPESASTLGDIAPECFKAWAFCECMVCSGALQCHVLMRARVGVCVGSHTRLAIHMRKKEASRCKVCAPANGCMLARVHGVQCVPSSYVRTVVVKCRSKNSRGKKVARAAGWAGWTCHTMWSCNGSSQDRRWRGPHVWELGRLNVWAV
jgi:hypothetical protein